MPVSAYWALAIWFGEREFGFLAYFKQEIRIKNATRRHLCRFILLVAVTCRLDAIEQAPPELDQPRRGLRPAVNSRLKTEVTTFLMQALYSLGGRSGDVRTTVFLDPLIEKANGRPRPSRLNLLDGFRPVRKTIRRPCC